MKPRYNVADKVLRDTWKHIQEAQLSLVASSLAYITILSIIPALAVSFSIFQAFGGMQKMYSVIEPFILENLAEDAGTEAMAMIRHYIGNIHAGAIGAGGLIALIFTTMSLLFNMEKAINGVWKAPIKRSIFQRIASYWFFITLGPLALSVALGVATSSNLPLTRFLPDGSGIFVITVLIFAGVYKWVPHRPVHWIPALTSALVTAGIWNGARLGYSVYTRNFVSYNKIYGSLAAVPIVLLWIYIAWLVVLVGAAFTAALQKHREILLAPEVK